MKNLNLFFALSLAAVAASCARVEFKEPEAYGSLEMTMAIDGMTKAMSEDELRESAKVNIYKSDHTGLVRSYDYNSIPSPFYLAAGDYRVDVLAGEWIAEEPSPASWDSKSYMGSQKFTIVADQAQSIEVVASVNNAVTSITFDPTVAENFSAYSLAIGLDPNDETTMLEYTADKSGAEGYFIVKDLVLPSFTWTFTGTLTKDGTAFTKSGNIEDIKPGKMYKMNLKYTVKDGELDISLWVDKTTDNITDEIIFEAASTGLSATPSYEVWAAHTTLYADVAAEESDGKTVQFSYWTDGAEPTTVDAVNYGEAVWKADIKGLTPATQYTYALLIDGVQVGDTMTLTTDDGSNLPNASFEYVSLVNDPDADKDYYKFYDPNCGVEDGSFMFWGSGNGEAGEGVPGSAGMGIIITTVDYNDKKHGEKSVCAQTSQMAGILAAGNLFAGQFNGLVGTEGGIVNFGRPWTTRPSALKLYCKYTTGKIDILKNKNLGVSKDDYDRAQIKIAIGTWDYKKYGGTKYSPVQVNTTKEETFVDFYTDASTIANGDLIIYNDGFSVNKGAKVNATTSGWIEYIIPLEYREFKVTPTHIVVSCASSQFGDYFTGCSTAKLWLDGFELIYE